MQSLLVKKVSSASSNPFYGMDSLLNMFTQLPKASDSISKLDVFKYLTEAWNECNTRQQRECFFTVFFSLGDIQNREHNIFKKQGLKEVDSGGYSKRKVFSYCLQWLLATVPEQFYKFMPIFGEYYNLDVFSMYQITTDRKKGTLKEVLHLDVDVEKVTSFISSVLINRSTSDNEKSLWARWLPHVPTSKRIRKYLITEQNLQSFIKGGHSVKVGDTVTVKKNKEAHTNSKDSWINNFIAVLSGKMKWQVNKHANNTEYRGYKNFRKKFLEDSEAAMFSSHRIRDLSESQLLQWFDKLPNGARFRTACRLVYKDTEGKYVSKGKWVNKYGVDIASVYIKWLGLKSEAQQKLRDLSEDLKKSINQAELKQMQRAAKVNTAGESILDVIVDVISAISMEEADVRIQSILDKINIDVLVMFIADISGSMVSNSIVHKDVRFTSAAMCKIALTIFLLKNPDEELSKMFIRFCTEADVVADKSMATTNGNGFMSARTQYVDKLVDKTKPFSWNLRNVSQYILSRGYTNIVSIVSGLKSWVNEDPTQQSNRIELINKYPIWLICSDGDINNASNAKESVLEFQRQMKTYFGWKGVLVLWDIKEESNLQKGKFEGIKNFMHLPGCNPSTVNQVFKGINNFEVIDEYLPLKTANESNRYSPVRELVV